MLPVFQNGKDVGELPGYIRDHFNIDYVDTIDRVAALALMEDYIAGRTENLHDYLIPTAGDVPPIESLLVEVPDPDGPFGAKGLGEHVLIPTAPAILNAIRDATGAEVTRLPALSISEKCVV